MPPKKYLIEVDSFAATIDAEAIARGLVSRCVRGGRDPLEAVDAAVETALADALGAHAPTIENDGELAEDIREAIARLTVPVTP